MRVSTGFPYKEVLVRIGKRIGIYGGFGKEAPLLWGDRVEVYHDKVVIVNKKKVRLK